MKRVTVYSVVYCPLFTLPVYSVVYPMLFTLPCLPHAVLHCSEFSESDRPFMDEDTLTHNPNVLTVVGRSKVALGPVRVKYIPNWDLEGLWCRPHYKNCCRLKPFLEYSVNCSHELKGWAAKYSFSRYTGYGLFTLERQESSAAGQVDGMYSFQLEYRGQVVESRNFSLVTREGSVDQSAGSGWTVSDSIGAVIGNLHVCV